MRITPALKRKLRISAKGMRTEAKRNFKERLAFIDAYVEWLKRTPNSIWSKQQKKIVEQQG